MVESEFDRNDAEGVGPFTKSASRPDPILLDPGIQPQPIQDFISWLGEISPWGDVEGHIQVVEQVPGNLKVVFYTTEHRYSISAVVHEDEPDRTYLGCIATTRKALPGESWMRGNDLPDGKLDRETWEDIKAGILRYEILKLERPTHQVGAEQIGGMS